MSIPIDDQPFGTTNEFTFEEPTGDTLPDSNIPVRRRGGRTRRSLIFNPYSVREPWEGFVESDPLGDHIAAFELDNWKEFWRLVREQPPGTQVQHQVLMELFEATVDRKLEGFHARWNKKVGALLCALGQAPNGTTAEQFFGGWEWTRSHAEVAAELAESNLRDAFDRGAKLTPSYAGELISIGWRNDYLGRIQYLAAGAPSAFLEAVALESPEAVSGASARRAALLRDLVRRAGYGKLGGLLDNFDLWWEVWQPFSSGRDAGDTAGHLLRLLNDQLSA